VHEADKSNGQRVQDVEIHFNFIDNFIIPQEEAVTLPTPKKSLPRNSDWQKN